MTTFYLLFNHPDFIIEFGAANKPGTVYFDPTTDALYELFQTR